MISALEQLTAATAPRPWTPEVTRKTGWIHEGSLSDRIQQALKTGPLVRSVETLAAALKAPPRAVRRALYRLEAKEIVEEVGHVTPPPPGHLRPTYRLKGRIE